MSKVRSVSAYTIPAALALSIIMPGVAHASCARANVVRAGAVADATTGEILSSHGNIDAEFNPASITKLISSVVIFEALRNNQFSLNQTITVAPAQDGYNGDRLRPGTTLTLENALRLSSSSQNGIYIAIARAYPGGEAAFVTRMNEIARLAGAEHTNFLNPNGLFQFNISQNCALHHTTIRDLFRILHYAQREYPNELELYYGRPRIDYNAADVNAASLPPLNPTSALLADQDRILPQDNIDINFVKTGFIRYSGAHIFAGARINGHQVYGIETGMISGPSSEVRGYRIRDVTLLNDFRAVRGEYTVTTIPTIAPSFDTVRDRLAAIDPNTLPMHPVGYMSSMFNGDSNNQYPTVRYLASYSMRTALTIPADEMGDTTPITVSTTPTRPTRTAISTRDNFLPASARPSPSHSAPTPQLQAAARDSNPAVTIEM